MSVNSKMTTIADKIRVLSGTSGAMGLDAMATHVNTANSNVSTEADLIAQIQTALEGKVSGGGSGTSDLELVSVTSGIGGGSTVVCIQTLEETGLSYDLFGGVDTNNAIKGSIGVLVIDNSSDIFLPEESYGITVIYSNENIYVFVINDNAYISVDMNWG